MRIRLTKKLANCLDGIDVSTHETGDVFEVTQAEGGLLNSRRHRVIEQESNPCNCRHAQSIIFVAGRKHTVCHAGGTGDRGGDRTCDRRSEATVSPCGANSGNRRWRER
jgi:hypothetical protein